jgi:hypothetical protein
MVFSTRNAALVAWRAHDIAHSTGETMTHYLVCFFLLVGAVLGWARHHG